MRHPCPAGRHLEVYIRVFKSIVELYGLGNVFITVAHRSHGENLSVIIYYDRHGVFAACAVFVTGT